MGIINLTFAPRNSLFQRGRWVVISLCLVCLVVPNVNAQGAYQQHPPISIEMPPGLCAESCRLAEPELGFYMQPVRVSVPPQAQVSVLGTGGTFIETLTSRVTVGMHTGPVYRFKVTQIPRRPGKELYPSIEILGKLNPPPGLEGQFPIEIIISQDDLEQAIGGRMISKVIYLENPEINLPHRHVDNDQPFFDVNGREDPLRVAKRLGRPMAILRLGSRVPTFTPDDVGFGFHAPIPTILPNPEPLQDAIPQPSEPSSELGKNDVQWIPRELPQAKRLIRASHSQTVPSVPVQDFVVRDELDPSQCFLLPEPMVMGGGILRSQHDAGGPFHPDSQRDEYVFDGDDRAKRVQVDSSWNVYGLDTEDTVGHYDTLDGRRLVAPSNRVAIYAPRFGAVRKLEGLINAQQNDYVGAMEEKTMIARQDGSNFSSTTKQHLALDRFDGTKRASGLINRNRGVLADSVTHLFGVRNSFKPYENLSLIRIGKHSNSESARLNLGIQSAKVWEDDLGLQVAVAKVQPIIVKDIAIVQEVAAADSDHGPDALRVTKVASRIAARAGETVEFTIRFDNLSGRRIGNVTIIDNLTRRLEYVPDTTECSLNAEFVTDNNDGGSLMLRWEITDPLPPGAGGVIRFTCRVR